MTSTAVQRFYRYNASVYDKTRWLILRSRSEAVERLGVRPDSHVLEIGCGTGLNFPYVVRRLEALRGGQLVGVDFSADMLARARRRVQREGWSHVQLQEADAAELELGRPFDGILFAYSLTMIPDWQGALDRAAAHLAPGGRLVVLDFGSFGGWGPLGVPMRAWLGACHVRTRRPYLDYLRRLFPGLQVRHWLGGYNFIAVGAREPE